MSTDSTPDQTLSFDENAIGRLMEKTPPAMFSPSLTVHETIDQLKEYIKKRFFTYGFVVDEAQKLLGVVVMRDLLLADVHNKLESVMIPNPFFFSATMDIMEAARLAVRKQIPEYPVCDEEGRLIGSVRGEKIFEYQAIEISAQAGTMVGVEKEERFSTNWTRSLKLRHPWLQINLLTAFLAGGVVSIFQETIDNVVILAVFLPILAGQSGNTGCQALAVTLRGLTLGEVHRNDARKLIYKEGLLGLLNGGLVGLSAAIGMYLLATSQGNPAAFKLSLVVLIAMIGSCAVSGISGAIVPLTLKRFGADPATASSIFLTTLTDIASMGLLLSLASMVLLK